MTPQPRARIDVWIDLACAHCRDHARAIESLRAEMGDALDVEWHAFELRPEPAPLGPGEVRTRLAFEALEAARDEGCGDAMRGALFAAVHDARRDVGDVEVLAGIAGGIALDATGLRDALRRHRYTSRVVADASRAESLGIAAVPATFVRREGRPLEAALRMSGAAGLDDLRRVVAKALTS